MTKRVDIMTTVMVTCRWFVTLDVTFFDLYYRIITWIIHVIVIIRAGTRSEKMLIARVTNKYSPRKVDKPKPRFKVE